MALRVYIVLLAASLLAACAGAEYPGFVDAAVEAASGNQSDDSDRAAPDSASSSVEANRAAEAASLTAALPARPSYANPPQPTEGRSLLDVLNFYGNWSVLAVSADYRGSNGGSTLAFDNARRDFTTQLQSIGFDADNISQLTMRPGVDDSGALPATMNNIRSELRRVTQEADGGCLVYFTSHGSPEGISLGSTGLISPADVHDLLSRYCEDVPTILIMSACYSGVFTQGEMAQDNRFIMTAARSDRTSFGCGENNQYPYFDACLIENLPHAGDWLDLARSTQGCVQSLEASLGLAPPSSPQILMGPQVRDTILTPFITTDYGPPASGT